MIYEVLADRRKILAEINLNVESRQADNAARKAIIDYFLDFENASQVTIGFDENEERTILWQHTKLSEKRGYISPGSLVRYADEQNYKAVLIADCGNVQAFPEAYRAWKKLPAASLKVIYGMEGDLITKDGETVPILLYAKDDTGIKNLYRIISEQGSTIPHRTLEAYGEGLEYEILREGKELDLSEKLDQIGYVSPLREGRYLPQNKNAAEELTRICEERASELFRDVLLPEVQNRLKRELDAIIRNGYAYLYLMWRSIVKRSLDAGYPTGIRGSVGSSLVAYLCGITEVNPLSRECGGHCIPEEVFMGVGLNKEPDIDINFAPVVQEELQNYAGKLPGVGESCYAGTISRLPMINAQNIIRRFYTEKGLSLPKDEAEFMADLMTGTKRQNGIHTGGIIICPEGEELISFMPLAGTPGSCKMISGFEYHDITDQLLKLDILGHEKYELLHDLSEKTGVRLSDIPLEDERVISMLCDGSVKEIENLPEFGSENVRRIIATVKPSSFEDLVKVSALSHGTGVWIDNQDKLFRDHEITLRECIASRDDIMIALMEHGVERDIAFGIMDTVRRGKKLQQEQKQIIKDCGLPKWYIPVCEKIRYLFPKSHAVSYTMLAVRLAYFMAFHPNAWFHR